MTHKKNIKVSSSDNKKGLGVKDGKAEAETEKTGEKTSSGKTPSGEKDKVNTDGNSQVSRNFNKAVNKNSAEVSDAAVNNAKNSSDAKQTGKASSRENGNMNSELFAGVKIKNIKSENTSAGNEAFQGRGEREFKNDPQSLLKTLLNKSHTLASRIKLTDSVKDTAGESMKNTLEPEISGGGFVNIKNAGAMEKLMDTISKSFAENTRGVAGDKAQPDIAEGAGNSPVFEGLSIKNGLPSGAQASSSTQMSSGSSANVYVVQEMISRMQGMIRGSNLDSGSKLSMNFESKNFGQVSLALQDKNGTLSVSIQIGNESSRQELMDQREELAQQLRMMGYKDVELDISEDGAHDEKQKENKNKGNEDIDNVKLAGDDIADRNEIFSGNFMA
jgi:hypothetical protein